MLALCGLFARISFFVNMFVYLFVHDPLPFQPVCPILINCRCTLKDAQTAVGNEWLRSMCTFQNPLCALTIKSVSKLQSFNVVENSTAFEHFVHDQERIGEKMIDSLNRSHPFERGMLLTEHIASTY